jgi:predicted ribosome quality control (RQC) complex YloA/Tae2 family protein
VPPREKYGLTLNGGGTPPSRFEWVLIDLCHRLHIRTKFDEELDEAIQEVKELKEQSEERVRRVEREQEEMQRLIEMHERALEEDEKKDSQKGSGN